MTVINTNIAAISAQFNLNKVQSEMDTAMERLSSGQRINSASDDAAGMAVATRMESQIKGLAMAMKNAGDAQALVDTTEGAHEEVTNILQRLREIAVQSANGTNVTSDRQNLNDEVTQLVSEINRISQHTTWNGVKILDGSFTQRNFQIGSEANQSISLDVDSVSSAALGAHKLSGVVSQATAATNGRDSQTLTVSGSLGSSDVTVSANATAKSTADAVNAATSTTGVSATAISKAVIWGADAASNLDLKVNGTNLSSVTLSSQTDLRALRDAFNAKSATTGVTAAMGADDGSVVLTHSTGEDIKVETLATSNVSANIQGLNASGTSTNTESAAASALLTASGTVASGETLAITLTAAGETDETITLTADGTNLTSNFMAASLDDQSATSEYTLTYGGGSSANLIITRADGKSFNVATVLSQSGGTDLLLDIEDTQVGVVSSANSATASAQSILIGAESMADTGNTTTVGGQVEYTSSSAFTVSNADSNTDDEGEEFISGSQGSSLSKISDISVTTANGALAAIGTIDGALEKINAERADLGAVSNRLEYTMNNLGSIKVNTEASLSRVMDADFAVETSNLTKAQILSQAATAMLAQANASKQAVLSLLQG